MTSTENFMKSYAYLTAKKLDADYSAVSYSGHGIISGYTTGDRNTESLVPDCYTNIAKLKDYAKPWDFSSHRNDVVVIKDLPWSNFRVALCNLKSRSKDKKIKVVHELAKRLAPSFSPDLTRRRSDTGIM